MRIPDISSVKHEIMYHERLSYLMEAWETSQEPQNTAHPRSDERTSTIHYRAGRNTFVRPNLSHSRLEAMHKPVRVSLAKMISSRLLRLINIQRFEACVALNQFTFQGGAKIAAHLFTSHNEGITA
jgi:hypothetical protein